MSNLGRLRQEFHHEFRASLDYIVSLRYCLATEGDPVLNSFEHNYTAWVDNAILRKHGLLKRNRSARHGLFPFELGSRKNHGSAKQHRILPLLLISHHNYVLRPYHQRYLTLGLWDIEKWISN